MKAPAVDPRLRVLFLVTVAIGVFFLRRIWQVGILAGGLGIAWLALGLGVKKLVRQVTKLWGFALFVVASYALTSEDPEIDRWIKVHVIKWDVPINTAGALIGALMVLRVLTVVMASQVARAGDERAIAAGLGKLGVPHVVSGSIDAVLALLGGGGGGGGRGRNREPSTEGFWASFKKIARGDVGPIVQRIERQIERAERHLGVGGGAPTKTWIASRDIAVVAGIALTMLGIKALKVLPNIPFAPGHKLVILTPLYIIASVQTRTRIGATLTGITMGTVAFLLGDGRYGIFEILKHIAPGIVCDLTVPIVARLTTAGGGGAGAPRTHSIAWSILGGVIGAARFATIFVVTLTVQAPAVAYAILLPGLAVHSFFGILSGYVSHQLVRSMHGPKSFPTEAKANEQASNG